MQINESIVTRVRRAKAKVRKEKEKKGKEKEKAGAKTPRNFCYLLGSR